VNNNIGMQTDLTATLIQQLGWKPNDNPFSKNLFQDYSFALYFNTSGYGFISPSLVYYNYIDADKFEFFVMKDEQKKDSLLQFSKAFVQYLHKDFKWR